jgi:hypothetical protein
MRIKMDWLNVSILEIDSVEAFGRICIFLSGLGNESGDFQDRSGQGIAETSTESGPLNDSLGKVSPARLNDSKMKILFALNPYKYSYSIMK